MKLQIAVIAATVLAASHLAGSEPLALQLRSVPATSGQEMFSAWCGACHGLDAKGKGFAAAGLKKSPADLTALAAHNGGKFPVSDVVGAIHKGTGSMPAWEPILASRSSNQAEAQLRLSNITSYLRSIQK